MSTGGACHAVRGVYYWVCDLHVMIARWDSQGHLARTGSGGAGRRESMAASDQSPGPARWALRPAEHCDWPATQIK